MEESLLENDKNQVGRNSLPKILFFISAQVIFSVLAVYGFMQVYIFDDDKFRPKNPFFFTPAFYTLMISTLIYLTDVGWINIKLKDVREGGDLEKFIAANLLTLSLSYNIAGICKFYSNDSIFLSFLISILSTYCFILLAWLWQPRLIVDMKKTIILIFVVVGQIFLYLVHSIYEQNAGFIYYSISFSVAFVIILALISEISKITRKESELTTFELFWNASIIVNDLVSPVFLSGLLA